MNIFIIYVVLAKFGPKRLLERQSYSHHTTTLEAKGAFNEQSTYPCALAFQYIASSEFVILLLTIDCPRILTMSKHRITIHN